MSRESHYTRNQRAQQMDPRLRAPALRGDLAALNRALDEGADPNLADADGCNPLIYACENNRVDCATRLIEAGARVDCHTDGLRTPLNIAARYGYADLIRVLLAGGAQIDFTPTSQFLGQTTSPLHHALFHGPEHGNDAAIGVLLAAHRSLYVGILNRGTRLPADVIPKIVEFWAHFGCYQWRGRVLREYYARCLPPRGSAP